MGTLEAHATIRLQTAVEEGQQQGEVSATQGVASLVVVAPIDLLQEIESVGTVV